MSRKTATLLVVASMVGTGIFTTSGLLARDLNSGLAILLTWLLGGFVALCGALVYAELCARFPRNGGEYWLLGRVYHPAVGFIAGVVSIVVGFAATIAVSAAAFVEYASAILPGLPKKFSAIALVLVLTGVHSLRKRRAAAFQDTVTLARYVTTALAAIVGIWLAWGRVSDPLGGGPLTQAITAPSFALGVVWVAYAYSGWNAAAYIVDELEHPQRDVSRALIGGTVLVIALYLLVNFAYLMALPREKMAGAIDVANLSALAVGGVTTARIVSALIAFGLIATAGAYIMVGARIYQVMAEDYRKLRWLARDRDSEHVSRRALWIQAAMACGLLASWAFEALLTYVGFTLSLFAALAVLGIFFVRKRDAHVTPTYQTWGYPFTPIVFLLISGWMIGDAALQRPLVALAGVGTFALGGLLYWQISE